MKFLVLPLVIPVLIAVVSTVDCFDFPDGPEEGHYAADDESQLLEETPSAIIAGIQHPRLAESEDERVFVDRKSVEERGHSGGGCSPSISCVLAGGHSIKSREDCNGTIDPRGCRGRRCNCKCCIPDEPISCPNGTFLFPATAQCFKLFNNQKLNWTDANKKCLENGLALAKPYNAIALRSYIVQRFGPDNRAWLGARGDDSSFKWQDGQELSSESPLWVPGQPGIYVDTDHCLEFLPFSSSWNALPDQPFYTLRCSIPRYPLCEATMAQSFPVMKYRGRIYGIFVGA